MKKITFLLAVHLFFTGTTHAQHPIADLILHNGNIITVDEAFSIQQWMAVHDGRILAVGSGDGYKQLVSSETELINLNGKTVMPGLIDSHAHPANASIHEFDHTIPEMESIADVLAYIRERATVVEPGGWIVVSQVFLTRLKEERYPTKTELDKAAPNHAVVFRTGPDASVNSLALKLSGIDKDFEVDDGGPGYIEKDPNTGEPNGILRSCTRYLKTESNTRKPTPQEHEAKVKELFADYNSVGITAVTERAGSWNEVEIFKQLNDKNELTARVYLSLHVDTIPEMEAIAAEISKVADSNLRDSTAMLQLRAIKVFMDGGMLTGSAYMRQPWGVSKIYNISDPNYRGVRFIPEEKVNAIVQSCMSRNVQFTAHCVGDGAVHAFIDACLANADQFNVRAQRPVICHSNFMSEEAVALTARHGICMDIQPAWLYLDSRTLLNQFGYDRMKWFQPLRSLFSQGAIVGGGSDHMQKIGSLRSVNFYNPWMGMWVAMTRRAKWLDQPVHPEQALSRVEAIRFYTINNAYLLFAEKDRGSLEAGKLADFIVLSDDILTCPLDKVKDMQVEQTYIGGKLVYGK